MGAGTAFTRWLSEFEEKGENDPEISPVLRRWMFYGVLDDAALWLLHFYVCAPPLNRLRGARNAADKNLTGIAEKMRELGRALHSFNASREGIFFSELLTEIRVLSGRETLERDYIDLPDLLLQLSKSFTVAARASAAAQVPQSKLVKSRALVLLYLHGRKSFRPVTDYRVASDLAAFLSVANLAAGRELDVDHDTVKNRISRFRREHSREFSALQKLIERDGLPPTPATAAVLLLMPILGLTR